MRVASPPPGHDDQDRSRRGAGPGRALAPAHTAALHHPQADGVAVETVRVVYRDVTRSATSDEGDGDQWLQIPAKILAADIRATPTWLVGPPACPRPPRATSGRTGPGARPPPTWSRWPRRCRDTRCRARGQLSRQLDGRR